MTNEIQTEGNLTVGLDGNAAFALLGDNLQEGTACFVTLPDNATVTQKIACVQQAFEQLKREAKKPDLQMPKCELCEDELDYRYHDCEDQ